MLLFVLFRTGTTKLVVKSMILLNVMDFTPISRIHQCTGCEKKYKALFWYQKPSNLLQVVITVFLGSLSTSTTTLVASSVFLLSLEFTPKNPTQQCTGCEKSPKNCFWYQKPSNFLQVRIKHNAAFVVCLSTGTAMLVTSSPMQQCIGCKKSQKKCFWYQTPSTLMKMRITYNAIYNFSVSTDSTKLVASSVLSINLMDSIPNTPMQQCIRCKKVQKTVFGTKNLPICPKCK